MNRCFRLNARTTEWHLIPFETCQLNPTADSVDILIAKNTHRPTHKEPESRILRGIIDRTQESHHSLPWMADATFALGP